jgi:hypothetical protein
MAKAAKPKAATKKKPSKEDQYERFQQTARKLGIDDDKSAEAFEKAFTLIVPPRRGASST